jgi:hypothetical protein
MPECICRLPGATVACSDQTAAYAKATAACRNVSVICTHDSVANREPTEAFGTQTAAYAEATAACRIVSVTGRGATAAGWGATVRFNIKILHNHKSVIAFSSSIILYT